MKTVIRFILMAAIAISLTACATSGPRLSEAQTKTPVNKLHPKIQKYVEQIYSQDAVERAWAVYNIGKLHKYAFNVVPYLVAMLSDSDIAVMTRYIGKNYASGTTTTPADEAVKAIAKIGSVAVKPLLNALKDSNQDVVLRAIKTLGLINNSESIKPLMAFISHKNRRIRLEAANSLSRFRNPWVAEYLLASLKDKDPAIRSTALYALGKLKSPVTVFSLIELLKDNDPTIRLQVLYALSKFRDQRVIRPLLNELRVTDTKYRLEVISALGNIRDYRVIEVLIELLKSKNKNVRRVAAESLEQIAGLSLGTGYAKWKRWWDNKLQRSRRQ
ncbi:hypothetical protein MNBD_GAMMA23-593 [hydrothermal vent metagenome]|uniref:HEAT repeat domain-containing protein n=1 Tax=hydrothermal vent metagenome TaxID=652676 RepID=A0A3B1A0X7_9ZZZZ